MTLNQALHVMSARFKIQESAIGQRQTQPGTPEATATLSYVAPHPDGPALGVRLGMDPSSSTLRVETIVIGRPSTQTERTAMRSAALAKFGPPTGAVRGGQSPFWCEQSSSTASCAPDTPQLLLFDPKYPVPLEAWTKGTIPLMSWGTMALITTKWSDARFQEYERGVKRRLQGDR